MLLNAFGIKVKNLRKSLNFSQSRLAEMSGIMRDQISRIENGQVNATLETIFN